MVSVITVILLGILAGSILLQNKPSLTNAVTPPPNLKQNYIAHIKNLTSISLYNKTTGQLVKNATVQSVSSISITSSTSSISTGQRLTLTILYSGIFSYNLYNASSYISKVANTNYFGFYTLGSSDMLVLNNMANASNYFIILGPSYIYTPKGYSIYNYTATVYNVTPTSAASGKTWYFCGGNFLAYSNSTWVPIFDNVTFFRQNVATSSYINTISSQCVPVTVR